jgi:hypothetical protein
MALLVCWFVGCWFVGVVEDVKTIYRFLRATIELSKLSET